MSLLPHLLRPWWLLALLALPLLWLAWRELARAGTPWRRLVDPHLLPSLLQEAPATRRPAVWLFGAGYVLAVLALAGPARQQPVSVVAPRAPLVIVEDMSSHMMAADLAPSRMLRARLKIQQLIARRAGGQLGLVAYAGDAFTVAPLSEDAHSLADLVVALAPDTMPVDGQRADAGLRRAADLLKQAGFEHGDILLLTDAADASALAAARDVHARGYAVHVLGIGTATGAPLPTPEGTFAQDGNGAMRIARLDAASLRALAAAGGGRYAELASSDADLARLDVLDPRGIDARTVASSEALGWSDRGPWLLLVLLPLAALGFRRGWLAVLLFAVIALPAIPAQASRLRDGAAWWMRKDQLADRALRLGDAAAASALAQTPGQRAAAAYRRGDYEAAAKQWGSIAGADADYNRGNALARMQRFDEAAAAYERALREDPKLPDARENLGLVRELLKHQQQKDRPQDQQASNPQGQGPQRKQDEPGQQGQSRSRENMQHSEQQAGESPKDKPASPASPAGQGAASPIEASQQAPDAARQAQADAAHRQAIQQALRQAQGKQAKGKPGERAAEESDAQRERREATETLLRRVPDDTGSLLRRKFALDYARRQQEEGR